ncbi:MAG TPA: hypothetical protein VKT32_00300 [Chthonomonadaceae bacterium]|nr:hypothetical protein [Chthonomonadaceae bacterium]
MKALFKIGLGCLALTFVAGGLGGQARADGTDKKATGTLTTMITVPKEDGPVTLLVAGQAKTITAVISGDTMVGGVCEHCLLNQMFKAAASSKPCEMCGCGQTNARCIAWKDIKQSTWQEMFRSLPKYTGMKAIYNTADKPESGLKCLTVDLHTILMPVDGLSGQTPDQLNALVKPFGGSKAALLADGKQLQFTVKDEWTSEKETKFEQALTKAGGKIVDVTATDTSTQASK